MNTVDITQVSIQVIDPIPSNFVDDLSVVIISPHSLSNIIVLKTFKAINANTLNSILKGMFFK